LELHTTEREGELTGLDASDEGKILAVNTLRSNEVCVLDEGQLLEPPERQFIKPRSVLRYLSFTSMLLMKREGVIYVRIGCLWRNAEDTVALRR